MVHMRAFEERLDCPSPGKSCHRGSPCLKRVYLVVPLVGLVVMLLYGYTPMRAAMAGIAMAWIVSLSIRAIAWGPRPPRCYFDGSMNIFVVATACAQPA
jgi:TRAP-type uncharacterized transport system fused permease subunit